ncbi:MAG: GNAT family N-acetyltransferase [Sciscionella sp.]
MIEVRDATPDRRGDVEVVMGTRGDPSRCWCQWFRMRSAEWRTTTRAANRDALVAQLDDAVPPGVLAYDEGDPAGWAGLAPRTDYPRLAHSRVSAATSDVPGLWAVTCFVVRVGYRRRGVAGALLDGAVEFARRNGGRVVEGYPIDTATRESVSSSELYHGSLALFTRAGFREVARPSEHRPVVRLDL